MLGKLVPEELDQDQEAKQRLSNSRRAAQRCLHLACQEESGLGRGTGRGDVRDQVLGPHMECSVGIGHLTYRCSVFGTSCNEHGSWGCGGQSVIGG